MSTLPDLLEKMRNNPVGVRFAEAARNIRDVRCLTINPYSVTGHFSAGGGNPADVEFLNREIEFFLDVVTDRGKKLE